MKSTDELNRIRLAAKDELERSRSALEIVGLRWSEPELVVSEESAGKRAVELKIEFYEGRNLVDIFEFFVCRGDLLSTSEDEVRQWIHDNVPDVARRRK